MSYNRQKYINKEYDRLITQAKKLYNEMHLGGIIKEDLPSFETILNYAGTKSGLKKPTLKSLKALRRVASEKGILWGVEKTLPKKAKESKKKLYDIRTAFEKQQKAEAKAKRRIFREHPDLRKLPKDDQKKMLYDLMSPISNLMDALRYYLNYCKDNIEAIDRQNKKLSSNQREKLRRNDIGVRACEEVLSEIQSILSSADTEKIYQLSKKVREYLDTNGSVKIDEVYDGLSELRAKVLVGLMNLGNDIQDEMIMPEVQVAAAEEPMIQQPKAMAKEIEDEGVTIENFSDPDLWSSTDDYEFE